MDMGAGGDFERLLFFEHARKNAEDTYAKNPLDADNLTRWGGVLIELSQFQAPADSKKMLSEAASKLEEALVVDPKKHEAMSGLANAHTANGFMTPDPEEAKLYFQKAADYLQQAVDEDPSNDMYKKSLEVSEKAPELHAEIYKQNRNPFGEQELGGGPSSSSTASTKKKKSSDLKYDVMGWVILAVGIVAWLGYSRNHMPPPPPPLPR